MLARSKALCGRPENFEEEYQHLLAKSREPKWNRFLAGSLERHRRERPSQRTSGRAGLSAVIGGQEALRLAAVFMEDEQFTEGPPACGATRGDRGAMESLDDREGMAVTKRSTCVHGWISN